MVWKFSYLLLLWKCIYENSFGVSVRGKFTWELRVVYILDLFCDHFFFLSILHPAPLRNNYCSWQARKSTRWLYFIRIFYIWLLVRDFIYLFFFFVNKITEEDFFCSWINIVILYGIINEIRKSFFFIWSDLFLFCVELKLWFNDGIF